MDSLEISYQPEQNSFKFEATNYIDSNFQSDFSSRADQNSDDKLSLVSLLTPAEYQNKQFVVAESATTIIVNDKAVNDKSVSEQPKLQELGDSVLDKISDALLNKSKEPSNSEKKMIVSALQLVHSLVKDQNGYFSGDIKTFENTLSKVLNGLITDHKSIDDYTKSTHLVVDVDETEDLAEIFNTGMKKYGLSLDRQGSEIILTSKGEGFDRLDRSFHFSMHNGKLSRGYVVDTRPNAQNVEPIRFGLRADWKQYDAPADTASVQFKELVKDLQKQVQSQVKKDNTKP